MAPEQATAISISYPEFPTYSRLSESEGCGKPRQMRVGAISCTPKFLLPNCFPYSSLARHPRAEPVGGQLCGIYRPKKAISHGRSEERRVGKECRFRGWTYGG